MKISLLILILGLISMPISGLPTKFFARDFVNDLPMLETETSTQAMTKSLRFHHLLLLLFVFTVAVGCLLSIFKHRKAIKDRLMPLYRTIREKMDAAHQEYRSPSVRYNRMDSITRNMGPTNSSEFNELVSGSTARPE